MGEHTAGQTVIRVVGHRNGFFLGFEGLNGDHRPENLFPDDGHVGGAVIEDGGAHEVALGTLALGEAFTAADQGSALFETLLHIAEHVTELALADHGAHVGVVQRIADGHGVGPLSKALNESVVDALFNDDAGTGAADLALIEEDTDHSPLDSGLQIHIGEDDVGGFAPQLQANLLHIIGSAPHDTLAYSSRTGEGDHADVLVGGQGLAYGTARPQDQVGSALRYARLFQDFKHLHVRHHGVGSGLEDDAVAGSQSRCDLPGPHDKGEVPGADEGDNTYRLMDGKGMHFAKALVDVVDTAVRGLDEAGVIAIAMERIVYIALGLPQGLAHVHGFNAGQFVPVLVDEVGDLQQDVTSGLTVHIPPVTGLIEGRFGSGHSALHVFQTGLNDLSQDLTVGRIVGRRSLTADALDPFTVNIVFADLHG